MIYKHIVDVSGGAASAVSLIRVIERFGKDSLCARFADVKNESPDLYRFLDDVEKFCDFPITRLVDGRTPWEIFESEGMFTNPQTGGCLASWHLKKLMLRRHAEQFGDPATSTIYIGFDAREVTRQERIKKSGAPWKFDFPLTWKPFLWPCDVMDELAKRGIDPPSDYEEGYEHANCNGECALAGNNHWRLKLRNDRQGYLVREEAEQRILAKQVASGRESHTMLKDRRGGVTKNLSLRQLREECDAGIRGKDDNLSMSPCACMGTLFD